MSEPFISSIMSGRASARATREGGTRGRRMRKSELVDGALGRANARMVRVEEQTRGRRAQKGERALGDAAPPWK